MKYYNEEKERKDLETMKKAHEQKMALKEKRYPVN